jgi:hypothetical protein
MKLKSLLGLCLSGSLLFGISASADEAEDSSAAFEASKAELSATLGAAEAESTVTTHENGMMSAVVGASSMKMLVVRKNDDGTLSYAHASNEEEAQAFLESEDDTKVAEE